MLYNYDMPDSRFLSLEEISQRVKDSFWDYVDRNEVGCWLWTRSSFKASGYGQVGNYPLRSPLASHRVAWVLTYGALVEGKQVLHHCDVRLCCRPDHLFVGTQADNIADAKSKGRLISPLVNPRPEFRQWLNKKSAEAQRGVPKPGNHVLSPDAEQLLVDQRHTGKTYATLGAEFGISTMAALRICQRYGEPRSYSVKTTYKGQSKSVKPI